MSDNKHVKHEDKQKKAPINEKNVEAPETPAESRHDDNHAEDEADEITRLQQELEAARTEAEKEKKEYLFLMADFDNFRKRMFKEKADIIKNASERVLLDLLPIVDDFERGLSAAASATEASAILEGMELIYTKLLKYLQSHGVTVMETDGAEFNPDFHEAIATIPAPSDDLKGKILDTTQKGYMLNDKVLRHAKVAVGQ